MKRHHTKSKRHGEFYLFQVAGMNDMPFSLRRPFVEREDPFTNNIELN